MMDAAATVPLRACLAKMGPFRGATISAAKRAFSPF